MEIIIDTNIFMAYGSLKIDIIDQMKSLGFTRLFTIDLVIGELKDISERSLNESKQAKMALDLIDKERIEIIMTYGKNADDEILKKAKELDIPVATSDKELLKRLKEKQIKTISIRQKKLLS